MGSGVQSHVLDPVLVVLDLLPCTPPCVAQVDSPSAETFSFSASEDQP